MVSDDRCGNRPTRAGIGSVQVLYLKGSGYVHAASYRSGHRAVIGMDRVGTSGGLPLLRSAAQPVDYVYALDHQDLAVFSYLSGRVRAQHALTGWDPARLQRAT